MDAAINLLLADGIVEGVVGRLKSGKEADVWLVQHAGEIVAAKIYKEREARSFRNNAAYREGRQVRNSRTRRAMEKGSRFGQAAAEEAWKSAEADALYKLHAGGVRVPTPVMFYEGVLLMEVVVDPDGHPAPRLNDADLTAEQAGALYRDLRSQVVKMLCVDLIHGDLSPFNVLLAWNGPVIIDFPQVIGAAHNNEARRYFTRDLENLRRFFARFDPSLNQLGGDAHEIWRAYEKRELTPEFVPSERPRPVRPPAGERPRTEDRRQGGGQARGPRRDFGRNGAPQKGPGGERPGNPRRDGQPARADGPPSGRNTFRADNPPRSSQALPGGRERGGARPPRKGGSQGPIIERINRVAGSGPVVEQVSRPSSSGAGAQQRPLRGDRSRRRG